MFLDHSLDLCLPPGPLRLPGYTVPLPSSPGPVRARFVSAARCAGMAGPCRCGAGRCGCPVRCPASTLILHCHGGGFISQSPASHLGKQTPSPLTQSSH